MSAQNISHDEVWDDSALLNSWNEAVEEYKHYHSLHVRGGKVEDVLRDEEIATQSAPITDEPMTDLGMQTMATKSFDRGTKHPEEMETDKDRLKPVGYQPREAAFEHAEPSSQPIALPHGLLQGQDDSLRNVMIAWYYAGYYTGLHEGQQKGQAAP